MGIYILLLIIQNCYKNNMFIDIRYVPTVWKTAISSQGKQISYQNTGSIGKTILMQILSLYLSVCMCVYECVYLYVCIEYLNFTLERQ